MLLTLLKSLLVIFMTLILRVLYDTLSCYWLTPRRIKKIMAGQGVTGPKPRLLTGNILEISAMVSQSVSKDCDSIHHDIVGRLLPHYVTWSKQYGKRFIVWNGTDPRLCITETELIKELLMKHNSGYARHMVECTSRLVERLRKEIEEGGGEVEIGEEMHQLTADIISRTEFGSSFEKGKELFNHLTVLQRRCAQATRHLCFPGSRFLPSKYNREIKSLKKEVERLLIEIIQSRRDCAEMGRSSSHGDDLLGLLLNEMDSHKNNNNDNNNLQLIMDECKTFFFAGHETTALLLTWTMMLLADNPRWQENVRDEIRDVCGCDGLPSVDQLSKLTSLNKVINESLRLYPPATLLPRMAFEDIKLGDLTIPKGLSIWIPVLAIHHSEELWGKDANEFNPERFGGKPFAPGRHFIPFAAGPRNCIGQSFAMMEAKIILATLISKFNFAISNNYRHAPIVVLTIKPKYGVQVILKPLDS
ncbi:cytokinin hydroxylase isoform X2 [Raphanus sativus]|uniref:Cytokinin hydroxylase isoform X2 n=1 Tax=Raphanus sativus TaxID=3726 RepID=A0A6J0N9S1_RAPSA|nr:cytokinin hydroxylase isoform X2 [Raphanus sativus]